MPVACQAHVTFTDHVAGSTIRCVHTDTSQFYEVSIARCTSFLNECLAHGTAVFIILRVAEGLVGSLARKARM